jgi:hypothetical protein
MKTLVLYKCDRGVYHLSNNQMSEYTRVEIEYDENAPCRICGLPVMDASMGGIDVCPCCDCGVFRNGEKWTVFPDVYHIKYFREIAKQKSMEKNEKQNISL